MQAQLNILKESTSRNTPVDLCDEERRLHQLKYNACYGRLTLAQKYSAAELSQYGYLLKFIRGKGLTSFAIFISGEKVATVDCAGEIDLEPNIKIRD